MNMNVLIYGIFIVIYYLIVAPRCKAPYESRNIAVMLHDTVKLRCEVEAEPSDTVRFSWTFNETRGDVLPIQNSRPRNYELTSVLEYTPTTQGDYGTLGCWASNSVGRQKTPCLFHIVPASEYQLIFIQILYKHKSK